MKKILLIGLLIVIAIGVCTCVFDSDNGKDVNETQKVDEYASNYESAKEALDNGDWKTARRYLDKLPEGYEDSDELEQEWTYQAGVAWFEEYNYDLAKEKFEKIPDYKDVSDYLSETEFGLVGNSYKYESITGEGSTLQVSTYSMNFELGFCHKIATHVPEIYYGGGYPMSGSSSIVYVIEGDLFYTNAYDPEYDVPKDLNEWLEPEAITDIVWDGDKIVSYTLNNITYTIEE